MRKFWVAILVGLILSGCGPSQAAFTDKGTPGQVKVIVFYDANNNGSRDSGEPGIADKVLLSQDLSCPPTDKTKIQYSQTDANGEVTYQGLKPGKYCVAYAGDKKLGSKLTYEISLSSDQTVQMLFALMEK